MSNVEESTLNPDSIRDLLLKESSSTMGFRIATENDIPKLIPLINAAYAYENTGDQAFKKSDEPRTTNAKMTEALEDKDSAFILATDPSSQEILGCVQYLEKPSHEVASEKAGYFGTLAVNPTIQSRGTGGKLLRVAENIARERGRKTMQIQVINHSQTLLGWYSRLGYTEYGRTEFPAHASAKPTQFILMSKVLI